MRASLLCASVLVPAAVAQTALSRVSQAEWASLNSSVGGRLAAGRPLALPCYLQYNNGTMTVANSPNAAACAAIQKGQDNATFLTANFGGYISYNFAPCVNTAKGCPIGTAPGLGVCYQSCVPSYYVDAHSVSDVQQGLAFAARLSLPLVIKNTGHDYQGRSNAPDSFAIWTHNIQPPVQTVPDFQPEGCSETVGPVLTYGAGAQFQGLYDVAYANGYMLIGGLSPTVGASGGYITGGGHSPASVTYGLAVDNVMQMRAVLPNGTYITANRCQNQDMFFALRGGGGGTFGVVTETTSRLYPIVPFQMASITALSAAPDSKKDFINIMVQNAAQWAADGWGGYVGPDVAGGAALIVSLITPKLTLEQAQASMKPLTDFAESLKNLNIAVESNVTTLPSGYQDYLDSSFSKAESILSNVGLAPASRLIPKYLFEGEANQTRLANTLEQVGSSSLPNALVPYFTLLVPPADFSLPASDLPPNGPGAASVTPAWRDSYWHVFLEHIWEPTDPTAGGEGGPAAAFVTTSEAADPLRELAPDSGAYINEGDPLEPDPANSFWGADNYARLLSIKKAIDPDNLLTCNRCVGWNSSDPRFACYPTR